VVEKALAAPGGAIRGGWHLAAPAQVNPAQQAGAPKFVFEVSMLDAYHLVILP
jgi:hypothetical protein